MAKQYSHNDIQFAYQNTLRKWQFEGVQKNGQKYILVTTVGNGIHPATRAKKIAGIISGSLKRAYAESFDGIDSMACGSIHRIITAN